MLVLTAKDYGNSLIETVWKFHQEKGGNCKLTKADFENILPSLEEAYEEQYFTSIFNLFSDWIQYIEKFKSHDEAAKFIALNSEWTYNEALDNLTEYYNDDYETIWFMLPLKNLTVGEDQFLIIFVKSEAETVFVFKFLDWNEDNSAIEWKSKDEKRMVVYGL